MEIVVEENPREHTRRREKQNAYEEWVNSIKRKIPTSPSHPCNPYTAIFRVPEHIRGGNENAYEPQVVSIGPYHRAREKFVDVHKWRYAQAILQRNPNKSLEDYLNGMKELEDRARSCYRETTEIQKIESNDFVEMMFVDGCFLVELFLKRLDGLTREEETGHQDDIIYIDPLFAFYLECDLCLLENQLPYFILECIFESVMSNQVNDLTTYFVLVANEFDRSVSFKETLSSDKANRSALLASLAITFIPSDFDYNIRSSHVVVDEKVSFHHLLHLFHYSLLPHPDSHSKKTPAKSIFQELKSAIPSIFSRLYSGGSASSAREIPEQSRSPAKSMSNTLKNIIPSTFFHPCSHGSASSANNKARKLLHWSMPTATMLQEAGVNIKKAKESGNLLKIKFEGDVMEIPYLLIDDSFNLVFRNFIAFEQSHQGVQKYFSMYSYLMDCLINTPKDVEILRQHRIIEHMLGSDEEVAQLFNQIVKWILVHSDDCYYSDIFEKVIEYCDTPWHRWRATLCHKYCSSPWTAISVAAAFVLFLLAAIQTFYSVFPR